MELTQIYATVKKKWGKEHIQNSFYFFDFHEAGTNAYSQEEYKNPLKLFKDCHFCRELILALASK